MLCFGIETRFMHVCCGGMSGASNIRGEHKECRGSSEHIHKGITAGELLQESGVEHG